jgi:hypothetical protein
MPVLAAHGSRRQENLTRAMRSAERRAHFNSRGGSRALEAPGTKLLAAPGKATMKFTLSAAVMVALIGIGPQLYAQSRWEKIQQKWDEIRPNGKWLQLIRDNREEEPPAENGLSDRESHKAARAKANADRTPDDHRRLPAPSASQSSAPSILNTAKDIPSTGVVLGIQVDAQFLPADKLIISDVDPESPAGRAGLRSGDQIVSVGGVPTDNLSSLDGVLASLSDGDQVVIGIVRNRQEQRALVSFNSGTGPLDKAPPAHLPPDVSEFPAPPAMDSRDFGNTDPAWTPDLRSVLQGTPASEQLSRGRPSYFPSGPAPAAPPRIAPSAPAAKPMGDSEGWEQLQEQMRQQQQLIDQLLDENQKLRDGRSVPAETSDSVEPMLDADGDG